MFNKKNNMFRKFLAKAVMKVICYELKKNAGVGKPFQHGLDSDNITTQMGDTNLLYLPAYVYIDKENDSYYLVNDGILVGLGKLDGLEPVDIIKKDCKEYEVVYSYIAAYALKHQEIMDEIMNNEVLFIHLVDEIYNMSKLLK